MVVIAAVLTYVLTRGTSSPALARCSQFRASEANEEITRLLNCSLSRGNATAATPLRRHLASATAALNNLIELGLGCNGLGKDLAEHPIIQPCLACVAEVR